MGVSITSYLHVTEKTHYLQSNNVRMLELLQNLNLASHLGPHVQLFDFLLTENLDGDLDFGQLVGSH